MSNLYYFEVPYICKCEKCGKQMSGIIKRGPLQIGSNVLSTGLQVGVNNAEMKFSKKLIESDIANGTAKQFTASLHTCPGCGTRQSWIPMMEPKKPSYIGLYIAGVIAFTLLALLIWAIFFFDSTLVFAILTGGAVLLGIYLPFRYQKKSKAEEYRRFEEETKKYLEFVEDMKHRNVHNKPEINWSLARHTPVDR